MISTINYIRKYFFPPTSYYTNMFSDLRNKSAISSCIFGISKISTSHMAILLLPKKIDYEDMGIEDEYGILIEYGDYSPDMCDDEQKKVLEGLVIYRYRHNGGLRYYLKKYGEFVNEFGNFIDLNIKPENKILFIHFIDKIAKIEDNKWIKQKYSYNFSHTFIIESLKVLQPYFSRMNIYTVDPNLSKKKNPRETLSFLPQNLVDELMKYYKTF